MARETSAFASEFRLADGLPPPAIEFCTERIVPGAAAGAAGCAAGAVVEAAGDAAAARGAVDGAGLAVSAGVAMRASEDARLLDVDAGGGAGEIAAICVRAAGEPGADAVGTAPRGVPEVAEPEEVEALDVPEVDPDAVDVVDVESDAADVVESFSDAADVSDTELLAVDVPAAESDPAEVPDADVDAVDAL